MNAEKRKKLLAAIRENSGLLVSEYVQMLSTGNHPVNHFLNTDPEGYQLAIAGFVAVLRNTPKLPAWAIQPGSVNTLRAGIPVVDQPSKALIRWARRRSPISHPWIS